MNWWWKPLLLLLALGALIAKADSWNCPICRQTFNFDPRDSSHKSSWIPMHLDMHKSANADSQSSQSPIDTGPTLTELARQRELDQQRQQEEEVQRQRAIEAKRQQEFERGRQRALGQLKDASAGEVAIKTGTPSFGLKGNPAGSLVIKKAPPVDQAQSLPGPWRQVNAAVVLSQKAVDAAAREDWDEAAFLGEQAGQAMQGGKVLVQVTGVAVPRLFGAKELTPQQTESLRKVYDHIVVSTTKHTVSLQEKQLHLPALIERRKRAETAVEILTQPAETTVLPIREPETSATDSPEESGSQTDAEALLRAAQAALAEATAALDEANRAIGADQTILQRNKSITARLGKDPEAAAEILTELEKPGKS